jgi:hypothetical protein
MRTLVSLGIILSFAACDNTAEVAPASDMALPSTAADLAPSVARDLTVAPPLVIGHGSTGERCFATADCPSDVGPLGEVSYCLLDPRLPPVVTDVDAGTTAPVGRCIRARFVQTSSPSPCWNFFGDLYGNNAGGGDVSPTDTCWSCLRVLPDLELRPGNNVCMSGVIAPSVSQ